MRLLWSMILFIVLSSVVLFSFRTVVEATPILLLLWFILVKSSLIFLLLWNIPRTNLPWVLVPLILRCIRALSKVMRIPVAWLAFS